MCHVSASIFHFSVLDLDVENAAGHGRDVCRDHRRHAEVGQRAADDAAGQDEELERLALRRLVVDRREARDPPERVVLQHVSVVCVATSK